MQIYLLRHGQTQWNSLGKYQGTLDSPLTDKGIDQAKLCGRALAKQRIHVNSWSVSPLGRARQTSDIVRSFGQYPEPQLEPCLVEVSAGSWDGLTQTDIDARCPGLLEGASQFDWYFRSPDGESYDEAMERVRLWLNRQSGVVVAISHGLLSRLIRGVYLGLAKESALCLPVPQDIIWHMADGKIEPIDG